MHLCISKITYRILRNNLFYIYLLSLKLDDNNVLNCYIQIDCFLRLYSGQVWMFYQHYGCSTLQALYCISSYFMMHLYISKTTRWMLIYGLIYFILIYLFSLQLNDSNVLNFYIQIRKIWMFYQHSRCSTRLDLCLDIENTSVL